MTKILLTRHGHVEGIKPARFRGRAELPLTEQGLAQADVLAARSAAHWKPVAVYTSPLQRCMHTAEVFARLAGDTPPIVTDRMLGDPGAWVLDRALAMAERLAGQPPPDIPVSTTTQKSVMGTPMLWYA